MNFDVVMPATLFAIATLATFLSGKVEDKLKAALGAKEFRVREAFLLVIAISLVVSIIVAIPQMAVTVIFLFAYSMLLFTFTYILSDLKRIQAELFCLIFAIISFSAGTVCLYYSYFIDVYFTYCALALYGLCSFSFIAFIYEWRRNYTRERWYLAVLPPAMFLTLYISFNRTAAWFPYLLNLYGFVFAVLITLYFGSLFNWRTSIIFAGLLTIADVILVLLTRSMVSAAGHVLSLGLPAVVYLPTFPQKGAIQLGLGDFFFAGLLTTQTLKRFGRKIGFLSSVAIAISFFIFEAFLLNYGIQAFPGTLMIICGWLLIVLIKYLRDKLRFLQIFLRDDFNSMPSKQSSCYAFTLLSFSRKSPVINSSKSARGASLF
jgi:hypothetical protein